MDRQPFMRDPITHGHNFKDTDPGELGIIIHYSDTCTLCNPNNLSTNKNPFDPRKTAKETRLYPSRKGWVAICYETKGLITFFVQLNAHRAAWQRIKWDANSEDSLNKQKLRNAIDHFLWVAECEEARKILPK